MPQSISTITCKVTKITYSMDFIFTVMVFSKLWQLIVVIAFLYMYYYTHCGSKPVSNTKCVCCKTTHNTYVRMYISRWVIWSTKLCNVWILEFSFRRRVILKFGIFVFKLFSAGSNMKKISNLWRFNWYTGVLSQLLFQEAFEH